MEDPAQVHSITDDFIYSDQTYEQCPRDIIFDILYEDGSLLNTDVFTWDASAQTFTIETSDYDQFNVNLHHQLQLIAHYEGYPDAPRDVLLFTA